MGSVCGVSAASRGKGDGSRWISIRINDFMSEGGRRLPRGAMYNSRITEVAKRSASHVGWVMYIVMVIPIQSCGYALNLAFHINISSPMSFCLAAASDAQVRHGVQSG